MAQAEGQGPGAAQAGESAHKEALQLRLDALLAPLPAKFAPWMAALDACAKTDPALAEAGFARVIERFPRMVQPRIRYAKAAAQAQRWEEAATRWEAVCKLFPGSLMAVRGLIAALTELGPPARLEQFLRTQLAVWAGDAPRLEHPAAHADGPGGEEKASAAEMARLLRLELGRLLIRTGQARAAQEVWAALLAEDPENAEICRGHGEALQMAFYATETEHAAPGTAPAPAAELAPASDNAALFSAFESLGGNCEFGFVQRHFGAEPIGLLRWVGISPHRLLAMLARRFDGIGEPQFTRLEPRTKPTNEIIMHDTRYGLRMHTFVPNTGQDLEALGLQIMRRMRFTRRKLLEDLEAGEKFFVFRRLRPGSMAQFEEIAQALRGFNAGNWLLAIDVAAPGEAPLPVRWAGHQLVYGSIPDASPPRPGDPWKLSPALWREAVREALRLRGGQL